MMTEFERQQVRQETIEEMLRVAINSCPYCKLGFGLLKPGNSYVKRGDSAQHFNGSLQWPCHSYSTVEALREASLQP